MILSLTQILPKSKYESVDLTSKISYESVSFDHPEMDQDIFSKWSLFQTIVTVIGLIANLITIITLISNGKEFPKTSRIL